MLAASARGIYFVVHEYVEGLYNQSQWTLSAGALPGFSQPWLAVEAW